MPVSIGEEIHFHLGPHSADPALDNLEDAIVDFIDGAQKRLDVAVQELENRRIAEALIRAEIERKVRVRLVLEADYLGGTRRPKTVEEAFESKGPQEANRLLAAAAMRATAWVRSDFNPAIFHQKFMVRDGNAVLTGSTNFTPTGVGTDPKKGGNLNHVMVVHSRKLALAYGREFREIASGNFGRHTDGRGDSPEVIEVAGVIFKICFAPDHNPEMEIMKQMAKAKERVDFAIFTFSQSSGIDDAMKLAKRAGIEITGVMDGMQANQVWSASHGLFDAGINLRQVRRSGRVRKLHHKLMTFDDDAMVIGSFNYTKPANDTNDENIMVIYGEAAKPLVRAARDEIERIYNVHGAAFRPRTDS
ncbi:MAG: phospholipase D-like domain-containing protein [Pseudomonadota bacterium]